MTRRVFCFALASAGGIQGAVNWREEMQNGDVSIRIFDASEDKAGQFGIGVRTAIECDHSFVEVFYDTSAVINGSEVPLLLHEESLGAKPGPDWYGATNQNFAMPRDSVQFIRVTLLKFVGEPVEFGREK